MKKVKIKKRGIKFNYLNKNDRIYILEDVEKCIPEFLQMIQNNVVYGCFSKDVNIDNVDNINTHLNNVSHMIRDVNIENNILNIEIEVLDTPKGKILQYMIDNDIYFNLSPACFGSVVNKYVYMEKLITFNIVTEDNDTFLSQSDIRKIKLKKINKKII